VPPEWKEGVIVHIYKQKGDIHECQNYRPICLKKIAYKIWPILIARRLSKILHLLTGTNQYGYKQGLSTIDALYKVENYIQESNKDAQIILMGLTKAFGTINRTQLWTTLYKKGLLLENITQIRTGRQQTMLRAKHQGTYGPRQLNNKGVFQGSAISALLFIIYLDDMMEDYKEINYQAKLPTRMVMQRVPETGTGNIIKQITKEKQETQTPEEMKNK